MFSYEALSNAENSYLKLKKRITEIDDKSFFIIMDAYYTYHGGEISGTN